MSATTYTAGRSLFYDPLTGANRITDIRFNLEKKLAACVATGGTHGYPIQPHRVKHPAFRSLIAAGMIFQKWTLKDLTECTDRLEDAASIVLIATMENPRWGQQDYLIFEALERLEQLQLTAVGSGLTL